MGKVIWKEHIEADSSIITEWHRVVVHKFNMGDVEDPQLYAAQPIYEWQQTEAGKYIMKHGKDQTFHISLNYDTYGYMCAIVCDIESKKLSEYYLKWGKVK